MAKIQIKSERLTPLGDYFQSWSNLTPQRLDVKKFGLNATSRIKAFVFRFIPVPAKWIRASRGMC